MSGAPPAGKAPVLHKPGQLTAMISSTAIDLPEHRAAVMQACLSAGVFPIGMEHLPARDATAVQVSLEMVDQADVYIGIYAFRYGWVPDGKEVSITEMEFDRALERQERGELRELLIFPAHPDHHFTAKDIEADATAQKRLIVFKKRSTENRIRGQFKSPEELRRLVSEALRELVARVTPAKQEPDGAKQPSTTIPHNLPSLQPFFGREEELRKIADALDPASRTWGALIDGPGGMGKTSLAVRAAYDASPEDFGRIVFISLKTRELDDDGERDLSGFILSGILELFNELARQLGHPEIAKSAEDQRPQLLLEALRDTRTLLLLDNLESLKRSERGTVITFVKKLPAGCKAILTSRGRIGSGAEELILQKLSQDAALDTLAELATHNRELAKTSEAERIALYTQTAGSPLLLRWTAGQIGRGHCLTFTDAIAFLRSCPKGNDPLEFVFGDLVADFSADEMKAITALTYFSQAAKVNHIATVAGMEEEEPCRLALQSLVNRSLAVPSEELQAFALVPMVADFLRKHRPEVVKETGDRLEQRAYAMIVENGYEEYARFPLLDAAWDSVAPALPLFLAGPNDTLQEVCGALFRFLEFTGRWDEHLSLNRQAEAKALAVGDDDNAGWRAYQAGWVRHASGQAEEVLSSSARATAHWEKSGAGARERAAALQLSGMGHQLKEDYPAAAAVFREALDLDRGLSAESEDVASDLNSLADIERLSGGYEAAEQAYREALRVARDTEYAEGIATYTGNLAVLALDREDWPEAETLAREALALSEAIGRQQLIALDSHRLAKSLHRQGKAMEGLPHARRAVEILTKLGSPNLESALATLRACEAGEG
ncbi:DUF4062 domain-containing protein [Luteolibacter sp. Populi]|uniref:DUF4062 domain-containing protein n=1 Tax=Luteolibacter sp. Populi TaxID=3230487 RepID=UPI003466B347